MPTGPTKRKVVGTKRTGRKDLRTKPTRARVDLLEINSFWAVSRQTGIAVAKPNVRIVPAKTVGNIACIGGQIAHNEDWAPRYYEIAYYDLYGYLLSWSSVPYHEGMSVQLTYTATSTGFAFNGANCFCNFDIVCTDGELRKRFLFIQGELNTSVIPNELNYGYAVNVYCGDHLTLIENGTFKGHRAKLSDGKFVGEGLVGAFLGKQEWTMDTCTLWEALPIYKPNHNEWPPEA